MDHTQGYNFNFLENSNYEQQVQVVVTKSAAAVDAWILEKQSLGNSCLGFDVEWRPTFQRGAYNYAALLQLATHNSCLLIQLHHLDYMPQQLVALFSNRATELAGVGVSQDLRRLADDCNLRFLGSQVELGPVVAQWLGREDLKQRGLARLAEEVLGVSVPKPNHIKMSNWEALHLSGGQVHYAALDAWLGLAILNSALAW